MAKLQEIRRTNGSTVNHITLPKEVVEESQLKKGDDLEVTSKGIGLIEIRRL